MSSKKKIVVCGATGFIGRNMLEYYATQESYEVVGIYNIRPPFECNGVEWVHADLTNPKDVDRVVKAADILIQGAATTSGSKDIVTRPFIHVTDNAVMNSLLLRSAFEHKIDHFVFFSCTVMYQSNDIPLREDDYDASEEIHSRYFGVGATKVYIEKMCRFFSEIGNTRFTVIRHSNIYGPHDKFDLERSHVFGATVTKVGSATDGKIVVWGTGEESRDLLYVADLVDFVDAAITRQTTNYELYNCGLGKTIPIKDLVRKIVDCMRPGLAIEHDLSQPTIKTALSLDCSKAKTELGWTPQTSLDEGIAMTARWWEENIGRT